MKKIILRGHHLLCCSLFRGTGYSDSFVERMGEVVDRTGFGKYENPVNFPGIEEVELVSRTDYVCERCPNRKEDGSCGLGNEDVISKDKKTLEFAGLEEEMTYEPGKLQEMVKSITEKQFKEICGSCRWYQDGYCRYEDLIGGGTT